jgi:3-hydroxyisobutyrate dehydrogenase-like beta-hydroxyacid dehydrogenase
MSERDEQSGGSDKPRISFLGLGNMGSRMAHRLIDAGYSLTVWDRKDAHVRPLVHLGATAGDSPRDVAINCQVLCSSVTDDRAVQDLYFGVAAQNPKTAAALGVKPGQAVIELSTILPLTAQELGTALAARGATLVDVGVSGSTPQAEAGELVVFAGGDAAAFARCRPILDVIGKAVFHMGDGGSGKMMKLVVNTLLGTQMEAMAEAITLGQKAGLDKNRLLDALGATGVIGPSHKSKTENARREEYPTNFSLDLMTKDFNLIFRRATELTVPMPVAAAAQQAFTHAGAVGAGSEDFSVVIRAAEQAAGLQVNAVATS